MMMMNRTQKIIHFENVQISSIFCEYISIVFNPFKIITKRFVLIISFHSSLSFRISVAKDFSKWKSSSLYGLIACNDSQWQSDQIEECKRWHTKNELKRQQQEIEYGLEEPFLSHNHETKQKMQIHFHFVIYSVEKILLVQNNEFSASDQHKYTQSYTHSKYNESNKYKQQ